MMARLLVAYLGPLSCYQLKNVVKGGPHLKKKNSGSAHADTCYSHGSWGE